MSRWISWAKAAPGVMVEIVERVEGQTAWQAAPDRAAGRRDGADDAAGVPARPPPPVRQTRSRSDVRPSATARRR